MAQKDLLLDDKDISELMELCGDYAFRWNDIGLQLGFLNPQLHVIQSNPLLLINAPKSYLQELLSQWVQWPTKKHPEKPSLRVLCSALKAIGLGALSEKVEKEMIVRREHKGQNII